jgi:uncharacterized protein YecT (DUF1311 family)
MIRAILTSLMILVAFTSALFAEVFLRDADTELDLEEFDDGTRSFELSHSGTPEQGTLAFTSGTLEKAGKTWAFKSNNADVPDATFTESGDTTWQVAIAKLKANDGTEFDFSGSYRKLDKAENLKRVKSGFEKIDAILNTEYQSLRDSLDEAGEKDLRDAQRRWIEYRDYMASDQPRQVGEGDVPVKEAVSYWESMEDLTRERVKFLRAWTGKGLSAGIDGTYDDGYGGNMVLQQTDKGIQFQISVVRGPTAHTGEIDGIAKLKGSVANYQDSESPAAKLQFKLLPSHRVEVTEENTGFYHGARAYFEGKYIKISDELQLTEGN